MRGQEEGPFALLLAAVMLGLLIPIVASLFGQFQQWECESRISNNLETMAREFELSATLGGGERRVLVDLGAYACGSVEVTRFSMSAPDEGECMDYCQTPHCRRLMAVHEWPQGTDFAGQIEPVVPPVCVRIPLNVEVDTSNCPAGLSDVDLTALEPGVHTFVLTKNVFAVKICEDTRGVGDA